MFIINVTFLFIGCNQINRPKTSANKNHIADMSGGTGHCFHIIGYNGQNYEKEYDGLTIPEKVLICKNSSSLKIFFIKFDDFDKLFSKYYFENKVDVILAYKQKIMEGINIPIAKVGYELGLYNGLDNTKSITREEAVAVITRALQKVLSGEISKERMGELMKKYGV